MDLDALLKHAAPPVSTHTRALQTELDALVLSTQEHAIGRRPVGVRVGIAAAAAAFGVVGATAAASAAGVGPGFDWVPWHTQGGSTCEFRTTAMAEYLGAASGPSAGPGSSPVDQAVAAAQDYLDRFDYSSIDVDRAVREYDEQAARPGTAEGVDQPQLGDPGISRDELELIAVNSYVGGFVDNHLEDLGLSPRGVLYGTDIRCDQ
jgi:hypothetical protein